MKKRGCEWEEFFFGGGQKMKEMEIVGNEGTRRGIDRRRDWMGIRPGRMCTLHLDQPPQPLCQWLEKENEGYPKKCLKQRQQWSLDCFGVGLNTSPKPIPVIAVDRLTREVTLYI